MILQFGVIEYLFDKFGFAIAPMVLGAIFAVAVDGDCCGATALWPADRPRAITAIYGAISTNALLAEAGPKTIRAGLTRITACQASSFHRTEALSRH